MTEQLLYGADIVALFQQVGGKRMTEGVARGVLGNPGAADRVLHRALEDGFIKVMTATLASEPLDDLTLYGGPMGE